MGERVFRESPMNYGVSDTPVSTDQVDTSETNILQSVLPNPIQVTRDQSSGFVTKTGVSALQHTIASLNVFQHLPRESSQGVDDLTRMRMAMVSGLPEEVHWALKKYLAYSNKAPYLISLKSNSELLPLFIHFIEKMEPTLSKLDTPLSVDVDLPPLQRGLTSILILRNLAQDSESTQVLATNNSVKEFLLRALELFISINTAAFTLYSSNASFFNELMHYVIDLMEAISSYIAPAKKDDPYFQNLVSILNYTKDRYMVISILRSLSRLLVRSKADEESAADNLHDNTLNQIVSYLLVNCDSELIMASLDFLYQYILPGNERIATLLGNSWRYSILATVLPMLLTYNVKLPDYQALDNTEIRLARRVKPPAPSEPPKLSQEQFKQILELNEPMRSTAWLRCCFEPIDDAEVTQISLWRGYESEFSQAVKDSGRKLLPAVEFIKNVSNAFNKASAMVITEQSTGKKRFVIKGIQPRFKPVDIADGERDALNRTTNIKEGSNGSPAGEPVFSSEAKQVPLPELKFPKKLSDVSKASATFLCLVSNDNQGVGLKFCKDVKPVVMHKLADALPLNTALSEYMDNIPPV